MVNIFADSWLASQWVGIAPGLAVCRLSSVVVCDVRALRPNGDRYTHDFCTGWQGFHLGYTSDIKQHRHRSSRFRAVAFLMDPPYVSCCKHRLQLQNGAIGIWLLWNAIGKSLSVFQNLTLDDLEEVISRSRKWKWPVSSKRFLLGPGCIGTKMFTIAQLIKVHLDLWPWLTFKGYFKVTNVKIAYIFLMLR